MVNKVLEFINLIENNLGELRISLDDFPQARNCQTPFTKRALMDPLKFLLIARAEQLNGTSTKTCNRDQPRPYLCFPASKKCYLNESVRVLSVDIKHRKLPYIQCFGGASNVSV